MSHYRKHNHKHNAAAEGNLEQAAAGAADPSSQAAEETPEHELLVTLFRELFQTEQSAQLHPLREAKRLGDAPPAAALRLISEHATRALAELPGLAEKNALPVSKLGKSIGAFLSNAREFVIDQLVEAERSYRGTLAGVRHGVDLVELIGHVAEAQGNRELADWSAAWLQERKPLVEELVKSLQWFAQRPEEATSRSLAMQVLGQLKSLLPQLGRSNRRVKLASPSA